MSAIQYQKIGLQLAGTKLRQGGFSPRIAIGMLAGGEKADNLYRATLVGENPTYVVRHAKDYIVYELIDHKVRACDIDTLGALGIIMTVTRDMQFADGKSPYEVLQEVYEKYKTSYMKCDADGVYRFLNIDVNSDEFTEIVSRYPLESRRGTYVEMNPTGMVATLCVQPDKLAAFFRDTQYSEFRQFKEVEVGVACATIAGLNQLEIPRRKKYSVVVNDSLKKEGKNVEGVFLSLPTDQFDASRILHSTMDVEYDNVFFTLSQLQENGGKLNIGSSTVILNEEKERIECSVHGERRYYDMEYTITGLNPEDKQTVVELIRRGIVKILLDGQEVSFISQKTKILVSQAYKPMTISNLRSDFYLTCQCERDEKMRCLRVTIQGEKRKAPVLPSGQPKDAHGNDDDSRYAPTTFQSKKLNVPYQSKTSYAPHDWEMQPDENSDHGHGKSGLIPFLIGLILGLLIGFGGSWAVYQFIYKAPVDNESHENTNPAPTTDDREQDNSTAAYDSRAADTNATDSGLSAAGASSLEQPKVTEGKGNGESTVDGEKGEAARKEKEKKEALDTLLVKIKERKFQTFEVSGKEYIRYFAATQRIKIEAVTNPDQYDNYKDKDGKKLKPQVIKSIKDAIEKNWPTGGFKTFDEIYQFRDSVIMPYIDDTKNYRK